MRSARAWSVLAAAFVVVACAARPVTAQTESRPSIEKALALLRAGDGAGAAALLSGIIDALSAAPAETLPADQRQLIASSLYTRAQARFGTDEAGARSDLRTLFQLSPDFAHDPTLLSEQLQKIARETRDELTALLEVVVAPPQAVVRIDDKPANGDASVRVGMGRHVVSASAPGHVGVTKEINIALGGRIRMELRLEASTATQAARTRSQEKRQEWLVKHLDDGEPCIGIVYVTGSRLGFRSRESGHAWEIAFPNIMRLALKRKAGYIELTGGSRFNFEAIEVNTTELVSYLRSVTGNR